VLLGEQPAGLNASADSEIRSYFDWVASEQRLKLTPVITELLNVIFAIRSNTGEEVPSEWTVEFNPLWQPTATERAETLLKNAQADQIYMLNGVASVDEVRERLISDGLLTPIDAGDDGDRET
jgi:phage-related protein (TIGR01555 family)